MFKKLWKKIKTKSWLKILAYILFAASGIGIVVGIVLSSLNFSKVTPEKEGTQFGGGIQTEITVKLDQNKTREEQLQDVQQDANALVEQLRVGGVKEISAQASLENQKSGNSTVWYGAIYLFTEQTNNVFSYSSTLTPSNEATQNFGIYTKLNNPYQLQIENANQFASKSSAPTTDVINNFNDSHINLNKDHKASLTNFNSLPGVSFALPHSTDPSATKNQWNLSAFQTQFTTVFPDWNDKKTYKELIDANKENLDKAGNEPNKILVLWKNRSGLVQEFKYLTLMGYLHALFTDANLSTIPGGDNNDIPVQKEQISALYNALSSQEQNFSEYAYKNINSVMSALNNAQSPDFGIINKNDPDPLLTLLSDYYQSPTYQSSLGSDKNPLLNKPNAFLYSWNFNSLSLINNYLQPIDYANFWEFFKNTGDKPTDEKEAKKVYNSNDFVLPLKATDDTLTQNKTVDLYNKGSFNSIIFNKYLSNFTSYNSGAVYLNANLLSNFLNFVQKLPNQTLNSVTTLSTFNGTVVGISIIILLIGIIVSILYRFPGVIAFFMTSLIFLVTSSIYLSIGLTFSFDTFMGLMGISILSYFPIMNFVSYIKRGIRKGLNLQNATIYGLKAFLKISVSTYIAILIVALVFLFFGSNEVQGFGSILVIGSLLAILFGMLIYICLYFLMHWLFFAKKPSLVLSKKYINSLSEISKVKFGSIDLESQLTKDTLLDRMINPLVLNLNKGAWIWWGSLILFSVIGIIGLIVLGIKGPGFSVQFGTTSIISFTTPLNKVGNTNDLVNPINDQTINSLAHALNVHWQKIDHSQIWKNAEGQSLQTIILYTNAKITPQAAFEAINNVDSSLFQYMAFRVGNDIIANLLKLNIIYVIMISIGFLGVWTFIVLNFINIIPVALSLSFLALISAGIIGFFRIPADINAILSYAQVWLIIVFFVYYQFTNYKINYPMKIRQTNTQLIDVTKNEFKNQISLVTLDLMMYLISSLIMMLFSSASFVFSILVISLSTIFIYLVSVSLIPLLFGSFMTLREKYLSRIITNKKTKTNHNVYDKIDEQEIFGINRH